MSQKNLSALVASGRSNYSQDLQAALKRQAVEVYRTRTCVGVEHLLKKTHPELIFTAKLLSDGTWRDVVHLAERVPVPTNVIVVSEDNDPRFYISAMDYGVFDFISPPFQDEAVAHIVRLASESVRRKRGACGMKAAANSSGSRSARTVPEMEGVTTWAP
jgi:DNA-binding NtrC family response regulator